VARQLLLLGALVLALAGVTLSVAASRRASAPSPAEYSCFLENTCPPCKGQPSSRSPKKEKHGACSCHKVTYQCEDGSTQTCWDNCE